MDMLLPWMILQTDITEIYIKGQIVTWTKDFLPLATAAIGAGLMIHIAIYTLAKSFQYKELENYAVSEIMQVLATAIMVGSLLLLVGGAMDLVNFLFEGDLTCKGEAIHIAEAGTGVMDGPFDAIKCRVQERAFVVAIVQDRLLTSQSTRDDFNAINTQWSIFGITVWKGDWDTELYRKTEEVRIQNNLATSMLVALNSVYSLLAYLKANMINMFLPLGILMRSFYFTRSTGALLISFGIGMYFIFPIFFVLLDPGFIPAPPKTPQTQVQKQNVFCFATMSATLTVMQTLDAGGLAKKSLATAAVTDDLKKAYIDMLVHPLTAFFMAMIFIRYLMSVLGGDTFEVMRMVGKVI